MVHIIVSYKKKILYIVCLCHFFGYHKEMFYFCGVIFLLHIVKTKIVLG